MRTGCGINWGQVQVRIEAGRKSKVRKVVTEEPPIIVFTTGLQKAKFENGIMARKMALKKRFRDFRDSK